MISPTSSSLPRDLLVGIPEEQQILCLKPLLSSVSRISISTSISLTNFRIRAQGGK